MSKFMALNWNGRARVVLAMALLAPPALIPVLLLVGVNLQSVESVSLIWIVLMLAAAIAAYALFAVAKLLAWTRQGLSETDCASLSDAGRRSFRVMLILTCVATLVIYRYEIIPMPGSTIDYYMKYDRWTRDVTVEDVIKKPSGHDSNLKSNIVGTSLVMAAKSRSAIVPLRNVDNIEASLARC